ncbi:protein CDV3 homolog isoform X2 [Sarcophilus harrisii]|uniref:protein CDV3 homolog isoform X2 n=2 Tax=Sarcophilus harrisii TaxID=9305 RepID=UPI0013020B2E|nr:protein CDV3 homolog isoform X2 [Sarcophilus harrisii]
MAETEERSLDNFFAKRDKKKKKERSSRAAGAANAGGAGAGAAAGAAGAALTGGAGTGAGGGGARPAEGAAGAAGAAGPGAAAKTKDEDEWKEFEQKEVDYSGLRVQAMQISEKEEDDNEKREDPGDNWEETGSGGVEKSSGPWNKTAPVQAPAPAIETPEPVMTGGVYRPPGARVTSTRKTPQGPPEIYSDTQFPSLQSTAKHVESRKDKEMEKSFEVVRYRNRGRDEVSKNQALKLQLDNHYAVLGDQ